MGWSYLPPSPICSRIHPLSPTHSDLSFSPRDQPLSMAPLSTYLSLTVLYWVRSEMVSCLYLPVAGMVCSSLTLWVLLVYGLSCWWLSHQFTGVLPSEALHCFSVTLPACILVFFMEHFYYTEDTYIHTIYTCSLSVFFLSWLCNCLHILLKLVICLFLLVLSIDSKQLPVSAAVS